MCRHLCICGTLCWSVYVYNVYMYINKYMYINEVEYLEDWRRRNLLLNSFLEHVLIMCIMSLWKTVR